VHHPANPLAYNARHREFTACGVWGQTSTYGKTLTGLVRITLPIRPDGRIAGVGSKVKVDGHEGFSPPHAPCDRRG